MVAAARSQASPEAEPTPRNEVILWGRLPAAAEERVLPSGDSISVLRVVVPRRPGTGRTEADRAPRQMVDTIDVVCWSARTRRTAQRLNAGDWIEVEGALRRRFFGGPGGRQSRYEVEAAVLRRLVRGGPRAT
ncbi:MAG TPA: single-stranded DNA-binding protein [Intrasporangium sp.]|nr:single-stranded DNA-binding protein [Intrasporangium sp.]